MRSICISVILLIAIFSLTIAQQNTFTEITTINLTAISHGSAEWGDYDHDGDLDLLLTGYIAAEAIAIDKIYRNDGDDIFTELTSLTSTGTYYGGTAWGDYDNDGDLDILLTGNTGSSRVSKIYRNEGGSFVEQTSISLIGIDRSSVAWGDYDNDGDLDILLSGTSDAGYVSKIYRNEGNNEFTEQSSISIIGTSKSSVAWGDYDNDGDLDFILSGHGPGVGGYLTRIYRNEGDNSFTEQTTISILDIGDGSVAWGDYDNDGDLDILLAGGSTNGRVSQIYRNEENNIFVEQTSISLTGVSNSRTNSSAWGDYDNDGDLDIILTGLSDIGQYSMIYRNNGDNTFTEMTSILLSPVYDSVVAWGDYDNDNDLDLIITGSTPSSIRSTKIYRNDNSVANTIPTSPTNLSSIVDLTNVTFNWVKSTDNETPQAGLKYNLVVSTTPGGIDIVSPMSDRSTGYRKVVDIGNTNNNNSWTILNLVPGTYYWSVQAIDNSFAGSNFATEQIFTLVVPVELTSFTAQLNDYQVVLLWQTATETNNQGFEIERRSENEDWRTIGFVIGNGTTTEIQNYSFTDDLFGVNNTKLIYRLKQIDFDGTYEYSDAVEVVRAFVSFNLEQNYPNPFNPTTTIKFTVPKESNVNVSIYNVLGEIVTTLVNEQMKAGNYEYEFNATHLASGVYIYRIKAAEFVETKKMVFMK